jgi:tripartite-type tricarboxylate transporter receptor subunit TctC
MTFHRIIACALMMLPSLAWGQSYPTKQIHFVVPFAAGGSTDILARPIAAKLTTTLGQAVIVENKPGGAGVIAGRAVLSADHEGYTLLFATSSHMLLPYVIKDVPFDPLKDFTAVIGAARAANCLVVYPALPVKSVKELVDYAKANPGKLSYVTAGAGTSQHVAGELLNKLAGINIVHVGYSRGTGLGLNDLLAGETQVGVLQLSTVQPHIEAGRLRGLGVVESHRTPNAPDLPIIGDAVKGYAMPDTWLGVWAPAATPAAVVAKLNAEIRKTLEDPDVRKIISGAGYEVTGNNLDEAKALAASTSAQFKKITTDSGFEPL